MVVGDDYHGTKHLQTTFVFSEHLVESEEFSRQLVGCLTTFYENKQECLHMIGSNVALKVNEQALQKVRNKLGAKAFDVRRITCGFD